MLPHIGRAPDLQARRGRLCHCRTCNRNRREDLEAEAWLRVLLLAEERRRCLKAEVFALDAQVERSRSLWRHLRVMEHPEARRRYYELLNV